MKISINAVYKLTLLWAFVESGLGGLLHGLHIPITGFVLGAFSVVIISLIACYSERPTSTILTSTLLVLAVKFSVSPHTPLPAYVAVLFQGCSGAFLFWVFKYNAFSLILFSMLAMIESAIQKPLLATIIFGKEIWVAIDDYVNKLLTFFTEQTFNNFSLYFLSGYVLLYALWGLLVGIWAYKLPFKLKHIVVEVDHLNLSKIPEIKRKKIWPLIFLFLSIMITLSLFVTDKMTSFFYVIKTAVIVIIIYFLITPFIKYFLKRLTGKHQTFVKDFYEELPKLKTTVQKANQFALNKKGFIERWSSFLLCLLYLTLQDEA